MTWIPALVFLMVLLLGVGGYFLLFAGRSDREEIKRRISLLEIRSLQKDALPEVLKEEVLSDVPWMNRLLSRLKMAVRIDRRLQQADMNVRVGTIILISLALFAAGFIFCKLLHWPTVISLAVGAAMTAIPNAFIDVKRRLRLKRFMSYFPEALEMFARSLRAGHSFTGAIQLVAQEMPDPIGPEFSKVFEEQNLGIPLRQALVGMTERVEALDVKFFVTAILLQRETGGNLAEIIDKISHVIRERFRIQGQLKVFTAQARLTGYILGCLPVAVAFMIGVTNPDYLKPLWFEAFGKFMIAMAVVLQFLGLMAIRKIIRIKI